MFISKGWRHRAKWHGGIWSMMGRDVKNSHGDGGFKENLFKI